MHFQKPRGQVLREDEPAIPCCRGQGTGSSSNIDSLRVSECVCVCVCTHLCAGAHVGKGVSGP